MEIRDRIKELRRVRAGDLKPNPNNWRRHPKEQQSAMKGILAEIGYADACLAREVGEELELIDGHMRQDLDPDQMLPVLILDLNEEEANKLLTVLDPIGAMAETDKAMLATLLGEINAENENLQTLLDQLAEKEGIVPPEFAPTNIDDQPRLDERSRVKCPECGHEFSPEADT